MAVTSTPDPEPCRHRNANSAPGSKRKLDRRTGCEVDSGRVSGPLIVINARHLTAVLTEFIEDYNHDRPHRSLALTSPVPSTPSRDGPVTSRPILSGLHHASGRTA